MNKLFKAVIASLSAVVLVGTSLVAANAASWTEPDGPSVPTGTTGVVVNEPNWQQWNEWVGVTGWGGSVRPSSHICADGIDTNFCDPATAHIQANSLLPKCVDATSENCIEGLAFYNAEGVRTEATFVKQLVGETYKGQPSQNLIGGDTISLWDAPGFTNGGGKTTYAVAYSVNQMAIAKTRKFIQTSISVNVMPYSVGSGGLTPKTTEQKDADGVTRVGTRHEMKCIWGEDGACGIAEDFPEGMRAEVIIRAPKSISGWFRGRIKGPEADITNFSANNSRIVMAGEPVSVPRMYALITRETTDPSIEPLLGRTGGRNPNAPLFSGNSVKHFTANQGSTVFTVIDEFRDATKDIASGISTLWSFSTIETESSNKCLDDNTRVLGIVTTNATGYDGAVPTFSKGQMSYKVAGMHYAPDGQELNLGSYDLLMRSDVARCLYKFTAAPVSASITVVNDGVNKAVGTSVLKEKNGWLRLSAYGFTFSSPTIKIKLTQKNKFAKTTITCVKNTVTKKVTGVGPKCPTGYKEK